MENVHLEDQEMEGGTSEESTDQKLTDSQG